MSTGKTILVHGGLAAGILAVVGYFFAQIAGMWVESQAAPRFGGEVAATAPDTGELTSTLAWRLPFTMAAFGFALVAAGEGLRSLWKTPPAKAEPATPEAEMLRLLGEQETLAEVKVEAEGLEAK